jgi:mRNA interferase MazF
VLILLHKRYCLRIMSHYVPGDVILVLFPHEGETKVRPAFVISVKPDGDLACCPIRSTFRVEATCIPITLHDFSKGGLDLFSESYVQLDIVRTVKSGVVIGKKGEVTKEFLDNVRTVMQ